MGTINTRTINGSLYYSSTQTNSWYAAKHPLKTTYWSAHYADYQ
jgi:hypothetical protein